MMSGWGIADTAPKIEKIKAESADYLHGLDSCGIISWSTYSDMFDFYEYLIEKAYAQGKEDAQPEIKWETCFDCPLSHGCPKIKGCTNEQAIEYASQIPNDCPLSTQPERKTGRWIFAERKRLVDETDDGAVYRTEKWWSCSECGYTKGYQISKPSSNYCENCGSPILKEGEG